MRVMPTGSRNSLPRKWPESEVEEDAGEHAHGDLAEDVLEEDDGGADEEVEDEGESSGSRSRR